MFKSRLFQYEFIFDSDRSPRSGNVYYIIHIHCILTIQAIFPGSFWAFSISSWLMYGARATIITICQPGCLILSPMTKPGAGGQS